MVPGCREHLRSVHDPQHARLIDRDNLALFNDPARVPAERLELLDQFLAANTDIVQAYAGAFDLRAAGGGELGEIFGSELPLAAAANVT